MVKLEDITASAVLRGIRPTENVTVEKVRWHGSDVVELIVFFRQPCVNQDLRDTMLHGRGDATPQETNCLATCFCGARRTDFVGVLLASVRVPGKSNPYGVRLRAISFTNRFHQYFLRDTRRFFLYNVAHEFTNS